MKGMKTGRRQFRAEDCRGLRGKAGEFLTGLTRFTGLGKGRVELTGKREGDEDRKKAVSR
jgi:hypothetical protein